MEKKELTVLIDLNKLYNVVLNLETPSRNGQKIYFTIEEDDVYNYKLNFDSMIEQSNYYTHSLFYIGNVVLDYDDAFEDYIQQNMYDKNGNFIDENFGYKTEEEYKKNVYDFTDKLNEIYNDSCNKLIEMMPEIDEHINSENEYKIHFKILGE